MSGRVTTGIRVLLVLLGLAGMAFAVHGMLFGRGTHPAGQLPYLVALVLVHDLVVLPVAIGIGAWVLRYVPGRARAAVQGGLFATAVVTVLALPFVIGAGRMPLNPTVLPLNYTYGLLILLGVIWTVAGLLMALGRRRRLSRQRPNR